MQISPLASVLDPSTNFYLSYSSKLTALASNSSFLELPPVTFPLRTLPLAETSFNLVDPDACAVA